MAQNDFKRARGVLPWKEGDELPEDTIRRLRDGCEHKWISVVVRLPERSGKYLVLSGMYNDPAIEHFDGFNWFALGGSVNWWMEIPKPPERSGG